MTTTGTGTTTPALRAALEQALAAHYGAPRRIAAFARRPSGYRTSFPIEEMDIRLEDGTDLALIWKDLSQGALLAGGGYVKPEFLYGPRREIETYRAILAQAGLDTATYYGAVEDEAHGRYWLFLERILGRELYQEGEIAVWQDAARWLARLHIRFTGATARLAREAPLLHYDGDFYRLWMRRAQAIARSAGPDRAPGPSRGLEWLAARYDRVVERLVALPVTFLHGEFYASNILIAEQAGGRRVCPVDWEMAAVGPGLLDLAALTAGAWTAEQQAALAGAYQAALIAGGAPAPSPADFAIALDCCRLYLAVQWLGWSAEWAPPPEHAQDWLAEALRRAERLEL